VSLPERDSGGTHDQLTSQFATVVRRVRIADILQGLTVAATTAVVLMLALAAGGARLTAARLIAAIGAVAVLGWVLARRRRAWTHATAARLLERAGPDSRNVIVTAEELLRHPGATRAVIRARVLREAASAAKAMATMDVVPVRRQVALCLVALSALAITSMGVPQRAASKVRDAAAQLGSGLTDSSPGAVRISATLTPPSYLGTPVQRLENPERIEAVAGSRLSIAVAGEDRSWRIRLGSRLLEAARTVDSVVTAVTLTETSYLAIEDASAAADATARTLIPIVVSPDRAPTIRIEQPGKDLLMPDGTGTVQVGTTATDDFGLASLELKFTKVSGSGEQFEFEEGVVPLQINRESNRAWKGTAALALSGMTLQPGDSLVYRVVGADGRPGEAGIASSETFFVEIAGPDQATPAGFELPPDRERHALSQQMIVLKIQRLRARESTLSRETLAEEAAAIAAEQRAVRANFIFLTGGHVADEEEEAEHSHEIQEGRLEHSARREISNAIQHMSRAEQTLIAVDLGAALPPARAAVEALQRAFGRNRYFLRTLPVRSRIDPSRRLSGDLAGASDSRRVLEDAETNPASLAARELVALLLDMAPALGADPPQADGRRLTSMAERALAVNAASQEWQTISAALLKLRDSVASGRPRPEIDAHLNQAASALRVEAQREAVPAVAPDPRDRRLRSAWFDRSVRR
jgi:hypothetical protein